MFKSLTFLALIFAMRAYGAEVYFTPSPDCENKIVDAINHSKKEVLVAVYSINNKKIVDALNLAHKKGVGIKVLTDSLQAAGSSSKVLELANNGIELKVHSVNKIMHNKFAIFDGAKAMNGSYNWTSAATKYNSENCVFFNEPNVIEAYKKEFNRLWTINSLKKSQVKLAKIKKRQSERVPANKKL